MLELELARSIQFLLQQHHRKTKILFTQSLDGANAARLDYELVRSSTLYLQPAALSTAWLILFSLGTTWPPKQNECPRNLIGWRLDRVGALRLSNMVCLSTAA